jgi:hypothetical protein
VFAVAGHVPYERRCGLMRAAVAIAVVAILFLSVTAADVVDLHTVLGNHLAKFE